MRGVVRARHASPGGCSLLRPGLQLGHRSPLSWSPAPPSHLVRSKVGGVFWSRGLRGSEEGGVKSHHRSLHCCSGGARVSLLCPAGCTVFLSLFCSESRRFGGRLLDRVCSVGWRLWTPGGVAGAWKTRVQGAYFACPGPSRAAVPGGRGGGGSVSWTQGLSPEHPLGPRLGPHLGGFAESSLAARKPLNMGTGPSASLLLPVLHLSPRGTA